MRKYFSTVLRVIATSCLAICLAATLRAQQGAVVPFQGQMTNQDAQPLSPSAPLTLVFRLYENPVGGAVLWEEAQPNIVVIGGRFNVLLGSRVNFSNLKVFNNTSYLGISVDDGDPATADVEMRPRQAIVPVVSSLYSMNSEKLAGSDWSAILKDGSNDPNNGLIRATKVDPILIQPLERKVADMERALAELKRDSPPIGTIIPYAGSIDTLPAGWRLCNGRELNRADFPALFAKIGTAWGSGSGTTFNLPDLEGRFLRGVAGPSQRDPDAGVRPASMPGGNTNNAVGSVQDDAIQQHRHDNEAHTHRYTDKWQHDARSDNTNDRDVANFQETSEDRDTTPTTIRITGVVEARISAETRVKNAYVYWIIKVE